ncbi:pSer/pThr/pTyr-binding forkhead associated (FHA) protein [Streptomyces griseochromogenes]|uniref:PSer/pThr/pTyr-binding forkhead associated (FHA) protein n=1 Tax=Streptomyces griseochromogenes TaxID=68214 RepID=A0ABS4LQG6_9ACTN|nr:FHA domain-containing protein [Streptomyces griseochromogenes]MBP2049650.1 pSer/pThr/pTyr-binding forkhead associated (FHA) protein [Streptomyces griseochromogenes]
MERPRQLVCRSCLTPLSLTAGPVHGQAGTPTVREQHVRGLRLEFGAGVVRVPVGGRVLLGRRDEGSSMVLNAHRNLSRTHATVGVDEDGTAWIRDEDSTNGTFLDDRRLTPHARTTFRPGARLRLAKDVEARVVLDGDR